MFSFMNSLSAGQDPKGTCMYSFAATYSWILEKPDMHSKPETTAFLYRVATSPRTNERYSRGYFGRSLISYYQ